jgi:acetyl esterase
MKKRREHLAVSNRVVVKVINHFGADHFGEDFADLKHARASFERLSGVGIKPRIKYVKDHLIAGAKVREYYNDPSDPYLVYLHGGGYVLGGVKSHDTLCRRLAKYCNLRVVAVDYQLAPEYKFPTQIEEIRKVVETISLQTGDSIYIGGDSAGGTLTAALSSICDSIKAQILFYPALDGRLDHEVVDTLGVRRNYLTADMLRWFRDQYLNGLHELDNPLANPILTTPKVSTFLAVGTRDPLLNDAKVYAKKATDEGLSNKLIVVPGALHGFMQFPGRFGYRKVLHELNEFLAKI